MKEKSKLCAIILPYFGRFNNYFQLFLNSCKYNTDYEWLIFTDDKTCYNYPDNVKVIDFTIGKLRELAEEKIGIQVSLSSPYKLCDFKPTYGLIFEDYLKDYEYWGHCDCDLLFGDLNTLLSPILNRGYDKVFAAGHLTIYRNNHENNRMFMKSVNGRAVFKEALQTQEIYVFDEDYTRMKNLDGLNIQDIYMSSNRSGFYEDLAFNVSGLKARFHRAYYSFNERTFKREDYIPRRYYWEKGHFYTLEWSKSQGEIVKKEYLYIHLQMRKMRVCQDIEKANIIEILPDRFKAIENIPTNKNEMHLWSIRCTYYFMLDQLTKKLKKKFVK